MLLAKKLKSHWYQQETSSYSFWIADKWVWNSQVERGDWNGMQVLIYYLSIQNRRDYASTLLRWTSLRHPCIVQTCGVFTKVDPAGLLSCLVLEDVGVPISVLIASSPRDMVAPHVIAHGISQIVAGMRFLQQQRPPFILGSLTSSSVWVSTQDGFQAFKLSCIGAVDSNEERYHGVYKGILLWF